MPPEHWRCEPCGLYVLLGDACMRCGAQPPAPLMVGATLHFTGQRIPKEE